MGGNNYFNVSLSTKYDSINNRQYYTDVILINWEPMDLEESDCLI